MTEWTTDSQYQKTRISTGSKYPWVLYHNSGFVTFTETKSSVDSGVFSPGVYRVNPYEVSKGACESQSSIERFEVSTSTYRYEVVEDLTNPFVVRLSQHMNSYRVALNPSYSDILALQRAYANLSGSVADYGTELGELKETLQFLKDPLRQLRSLWDRRTLERFMRAAKSGRFGKSVLSEASEISSAWLEFRYGLMPIIRSLQQVFEILKDGLPSFEPGKIYSYRGRAAEESKSSISNDGLIGGSPITTYRGRVRITEKVICNGSVQCTYNTPPALTDILGLSPFDIPAIAWELTRLSFIVDRFIALGPWIQALRFNPGVDVLGNTLGVKRIVEVEADSIERSFVWVPTWQPSTVKSVRVTYNGYQRIVDSPIYTQVAVPFGFDQSLAQILDEVALLIKAIK